MDVKTIETMDPWEWPDDAGQTFLRLLRDTNADDAERLIAAELAGDFTVINDALAEALMAIVLNDGEPDDLRARAAISFGPALEQADVDEFEDPEDVPISEPVFHRIRKALHRVYTGGKASKEVRRRILEASVRAPEEWHHDAIRAAYSSGDEDWVLTAVFCMQWVRGFQEEIVESLKNPSPLIEYEAVCAAGNWEVDAAWPYIAALLESENTGKDLLLAAMEAAACIRPQEAPGLLGGFLDSSDEDIADTAYEAVSMAEAFSEEDEEDDENSFN